MNWLGNLLIIVGISFDVYAAMEVRGAMLAKIKPKVLILTGLLFTLIQSIFFFGGYFITYEMVMHNEVKNADSLGCELAAVIFFVLAARLFHKALKHEEIEEKCEEMSIKMYVRIILAGAMYTLIAGLACGLIGTNHQLPQYIIMMLLFIICTTIVVVSAGIYTGYRFGFSSKPKFYIVGTVLLGIAGLWSLLIGIF
ncbi:MAG: manganese efflux pump [Lachnospiraceae bacterium]|nr:manganese efflux pump [Lachnospiraceae bacterium]MDD7664834.1 manganese efflux pump [Lachnospiraceae bacterium]MDY4164711.1 manganese efflux pump [Lachnospiraceae bacterium]